MIENFLQTTVPNAVNNISLFTFLIIFIGGILTSISPCVLSMIPVVIGYIGGYAERSRIRGFVMSLMMVLGLSTTFAILGVIAASLGKVFGQIGNGWLYAVGIVAIVMGLHLMGVININFPTLKKFPIKAEGLGGAYLAGLFFGLAMSPCATPVLAVIITFVASKGQPVYGAALLFVYGLGHGLPLLLVGTFTAMIKNIGKLQRYTRYVTVISGGVLVLLGLYIFVRLRWF